MSPLRQQMIDAMVLRGLARRTQQAYLSVVAQLAAHYHCSPDRLDGAQVKAWLLHRITERHLAYTTVNQAARPRPSRFPTRTRRSVSRRSSRARNWRDCSRRPPICARAHC